MQKSRLKRLERWVNESQAVRISWAGIDNDGVIQHGPQPEIAPWIGRHVDEMPFTTKLYLTGPVPGERDFRPDVA